MAEEFDFTKFSKAVLMGFCVLSAIAILKWIGVFSFEITVGI